MRAHGVHLQGCCKQGLPWCVPASQHDVCVPCCNRAILCCFVPARHDRNAQGLSRTRCAAGTPIPPRPPRCSPCRPAARHAHAAVASRAGYKGYCMYVVTHAIERYCQGSLMGGSIRLPKGNDRPTKQGENRRGERTHGGLASHTVIRARRQPVTRPRSHPQPRNRRRCPPPRQASPPAPGPPGPRRRPRQQHPRPGHHHHRSRRRRRRSPCPFAAA